MASRNTLPNGYSFDTNGYSFDGSDDSIDTASVCSDTSNFTDMPVAVSVVGGGGAGRGGGAAGGEIERLKLTLAMNERELRQELSAGSPHDKEKIQKLTESILELDTAIKSAVKKSKRRLDPRSSKVSDEDTKESDEDSKSCTQDEKKKNLMDFSLKENISKFIQSRWKWNEDDGSTAKGCIRLNPKGLFRPTDKNIQLTLVLDVSYSMNDAPLEQLGKKLIAITRYLVDTNLTVHLTCIRYGAHSDTFIDNVLLTVDSIRDVCIEIREKIGTPAVKSGPNKGGCLMGGKGGIRTDTRFEAPLRSAFESVKDCYVDGNSVGVIAWYSDGKERSTDTDVIALAQNVFQNGIGNLNVDLCSCAYGKATGEGTKMQKLATWWHEHCNNGSGFFSSANSIAGLALFTKESAFARFFSPMATDIFITLPDGEIINYDKITENPIDIPIEAPIGMSLRLGLTNMFSLERINPMITVEFCQPGIGEEGQIFTIQIPTIDPVQINRNGTLVSSGQTEIAHIIKEINELQKGITGLRSEARRELEISKKCLHLMKKIGFWDTDGNWNPNEFNVGSSRNTAAKHQIPKVDRYTEIKVAINTAKRIIKGCDTEDDAYQMQAAVRGFSQSCESATKGDSTRSAYCSYSSFLQDEC